MNQPTQEYVQMLQTENETLRKRLLEKEQTVQALNVMLVMRNSREVMAHRSQDAAIPNPFIHESGRPF